MLKNGTRKTLAAVGVTAVLFTGAQAASAFAVADGELVKGGDFEYAGLATEGLDADATTDFKFSDPTVMAEYDQVGMWAPMRYTVASNPSAVHPYWVNKDLGSNWLILNGTDVTGENGSAAKAVWAQNVDLPHQMSEFAKTFDLIAGQNTKVGTVTVTPDGPGTVTVKYVVNVAGYTLANTHVAVGDDTGDLLGGKSSATPGQFPYKHDNLPAGTTEDVFTKVPVGAVDQEWLLATHASVVKTTTNPDGTVTTKGDTAWSGTVNFGKNWATYAKFTFPKLPSYDFSVDAMNILPKQNVVPGQALGAHVTVWINGKQVGEKNLTELEAGETITIPKRIAYADTMKIEIRNDAAVYHGNDFAIDNVSLVEHK